MVDRKSKLESLQEQQVDLLKDVVGGLEQQVRQGAVQDPSLTQRESSFGEAFSQASGLDKAAGLLTPGGAGAAAGAAAQATLQAAITELTAGIRNQTNAYRRASGLESKAELEAKAQFETGSVGERIGRFGAQVGNWIQPGLGSAIENYVEKSRFQRRADIAVGIQGAEGAASQAYNQLAIQARLTGEAPSKSTIDAVYRQYEPGERAVAELLRRVNEVKAETTSRLYSDPANQRQFNSQ